MEDNFNAIQDKMEYISSLGIYELRGLARNLGIKSPTTKLREKLIEEISTALLTGQVLEPRNNRKGRPSKQLAHMDDIMSFVAPNERANDSIIIFNQQLQPFTMKTDVEKVRGIVRNSEKSPFLYDLVSANKILISQQMIQQYGLTDGDLVSAEAFKINEKEDFYVKKLLSLNGEKADNYKPKEEIVLDRTLPSKFLDFGNSSLLLGGRNYILTNAPLFMCNPFKHILETLENQDAVNIFIGCNMCYEDKYYMFGRKNFVNFTTDYAGGQVSALDRMIDAINFASRLSAQGKNVNIIVSDIKNLLLELDQKFADDERVNGHARQTDLLVKKLVSLAGANMNEVCTTLLVSCDENDCQDEFIRQHIIKISNNVFAR